MKRYEDLTFKDDFMFGKVMLDNELCRRVLETLLQQPIGELSAPYSQKEIKVTKEGKPIRLDIYTEEENGSTVYDTEMQQLGNKSIESLQLPRRSRFYQGSIDMDLLSKGSSYKVLKDCNIIFICTFDPFGKGLYRYSFEEICLEKENLKLDNGTRKIFYNTSAPTETVPVELRELFEYINTGIPQNELTKQIEGVIANARKNSEWGSAYMKEKLIYQDMWDDGYCAGKNEGLEQGARLAIVSLYKAGKLTVEDAIEILQISREEFNKLVK